VLRIYILFDAHHCAVSLISPHTMVLGYAVPCRILNFAEHRGAGYVVPFFSVSLYAVPLISLYFVPFIYMSFLFGL